MKIISVPMMLLFFLVMTTVSAQGDGPARKSETSCFSASRFDLVDQYVAQQSQKNPNAVFNYGGYEISAVNDQEINFKKDGYKLAIINRDKGVLILSKSQEQSRALTDEVEKVFCQLVEEQKKNK